MSLVVVLFAIVATITAVSAMFVVINRSVVRAAIGLLFTLIGISLLYFLLGAEFIGAAQLIVYVGGTMVLMVFGVMITNQGPFAGIVVKKREWLIGGTLATALFVGLTLATFKLSKPADDTPLPNIDAIGQSLLGVSKSGETAYLLPFEIVSVHLLVVLIAAAYLARNKRKAIKS